MTVVGLATVLAATTFDGFTATSAAFTPEPVQQVKPVQGRAVPVAPPAPDKAAERAMADVPAAVWPKAAAAEVVLPAAAPARAAGGSDQARVGDLPVWLAGAGTAAKVRVELLDRATAEKAKVDGMLLRLRRADADVTAAAVSVEVDYSSFRHAYGGDWANRLVLTRLPECALSTPDLPACAGTPLPTRNRTDTGRLAAEVSVPSAKTAAAQPALFAVTAAAAGSSGDYTATALSSSSEWSAGGSSGDFTWSYPMRTPPVGPAPPLALGYSAASVDGRTVSTNNQPSWVGEGFGFSPGAINRTYKSCADDMTGGNNAEHKTGDLCWAGENVSLTLGSRSSELVLDAASGSWRLRDDDGSRVEQLSDPSLANGDHGNQYWRVTTTDGTQYFFGRHRLPGWATGMPVTNSVWTVPVFGNHAGEPCRKDTFAASWCHQAWTWNLDYVVDVKGFSTSYYYNGEENFYGRDMTATADTRYVRGGWLDRIEYGDRAGTEHTTNAPARVLFDVAERCIPGGAVTCAPAQLTKDTAKHWPDVPADRICKSGESCTDRFSPTFFTRKRLAKVRTEVWRPAGYAPVDSWALTHTYPAPGDGTSAGLWLESIKHTGHVGGTDASTPEINFDGVQRANRVDALEGQPSLSKWRISTVHNETGGDLFVEYAADECVRNVRMPASADSNTLRCFPQRWAPPNEPERLDWFHKTVVARVSLTDRVGLSPPEITHYEYVGPAAWHWDDSDLTPAKKKTWGQWRGYGHVKVRHGADGDPQSSTETRYFRGMDGDRLANGTNRDVKITDAGGTVEDHWRLAGTVRETITYNGPGGAMVSGTITDPWLRGPTAARTRDGRPFQAYLRGEGKVRSRLALAAGGLRTSEVVNTHDAEGQVIQVNDLGGPGAEDDRCTTTNYARNDTKWLLSPVSQTRTIAVACGGQPASADDVLTDVRTYYDGSNTLDAQPDKGNATKVETIAAWSPAGSTYRTTRTTTYDAYSRPLVATDSLGSKAETAYIPATGGPVTSTKVTNSLGFVTTSDVEPAWGEPLSKTDENGKRTDLQYDGLGRLLKVWLPGRAKAASHDPQQEFSYLVRNNGPSATISKALQGDGTYKTSYALYDGQLRSRQTQTPTIDGQRIVADTVYNSRGLVAKRNAPYLNADPAGTSLLEVVDQSVPSQTVTTYDGADRATAEIFKIKNVEYSRATTTYGGDRVTIDPPDGATPTTKITDSRGNTVELRQYHAKTPTGDYDATKYTVNKRGGLTQVVDPANNVWRYSYDIEGRQIRKEDPDTGVSTMVYDQAGQLIEVTDSRSITMLTSYDSLGRRTAVKQRRESAVTTLAEWTYDKTLVAGKPVLGKPTSATRYAGGSAYMSTVDGYDDAYRVTSASVTIPASEGNLAGRYETHTSYDLAGHVTLMSYPAGGGLDAETVRYTYDSFGQAKRAESGLSTYVTDAAYSPYGELLRQTLSAGDKFVLLTRSYEEGTRRLARSLVQRETAPAKVADVGYKYDQAGNVLRIEDSVSADLQCFEFDYLRRLQEAWTPAAATDCAPAARNAQTLSGPAPYWNSYRHDKTGNRTEEIRHAGTGDTTSKYNYLAASHKLLSVQTTGPAGTRTDEYAYDSAGNTTSRTVGGEAQALEWDGGGKLAKVTKGDQATSFVYDTDGGRLLRRDPTGTTLYIGGTEFRQDTAGKVTANRYYQHAGSTVAMRTSSGITWLSADHHGTGDVAITATDQKVTQRRTTPFGEERGASGTWPNERGFLNGTKDPSTGLTHLGAREYDPRTGRFISADPLIDHNDPQQMNGYAYANGNPVTISDPSGLIPCTEKEECDWYRENNQGKDHHHDAKQRKSEYEAGRSGSARSGGKPPRVKAPPQIYIQLPCSAAAAAMGPCYQPIVPLVDCHPSGTSGEPCYIDPSGKLVDFNGYARKNVFGYQDADGTWKVSYRGVSCDDWDEVAQQARGRRGPRVKEPSPAKGTVSLCVGAGGVLGVFSAGRELCVGFDRRGMGLYTGRKEGYGYGAAVGANVGVNISDKETVAQLEGTDPYAAISSPVKPGVDGEISSSPGQFGVAVGPGIGLEIPAKVSGTAGKSHTENMWWRPWGQIFSPPGLNG